MYHLCIQKILDKLNQTSSNCRNLLKLICCNTKNLNHFHKSNQFPCSGQESGHNLVRVFYNQNLATRQTKGYYNMIQHDYLACLLKAIDSVTICLVLEISNSQNHYDYIFFIHSTFLYWRSLLRYRHPALHFSLGSTNDIFCWLCGTICCPNVR